LGKDGESYQKDIAEGLTVLRATVMNPFSVDANPDYLLGLTDAVRRAAISFLGESFGGRQLVREQANIQREVDITEAGLFRVSRTEIQVGSDTGEKR